MKQLKSALLGLVMAAVVQPALAAEDIQATLHWARRVELGMLVSGVVEDVYVGSGQHVLAGEALVMLDTRDFEARLAGASAHLAAVAPALEEARQELERAEDLFDRTLLAEHDLETARIAVAKLDAKRAQADARLARAALRLERGTLRAPFAGIVVARNAEAGQAIVSRCESRTLIVLAGSKNFIARAALDAQGLASIQIGQVLPVLTGNLSLVGKVAAIAPEPLPDRTDGLRFVIDVLFPQPADGKLRVGQTVTLKLP